MTPRCRSCDDAKHSFDDIAAYTNCQKLNKKFTTPKTSPRCCPRRQRRVIGTKED